MASSENFISLSPKMGGGAFVSPFEWNENSIVIIKYKHGGGHIRAHPHNHELCDHKGGQTEWAKWKVHLSENGRIAQLEHLKTGKYLQMDKFVSSINVASEGGSTSRWVVHPVGTNCVRLESERNEGYFLGVKPHDGVTVVNASKLDKNSYQFQFTYLYFFIEGQKDEGYFKKPYLMKQQNTIVIKHPQNASLRTNPNDERELDTDGQKEMNARWEAIVTFIDSNDNKSNTNNNNNNLNGDSSNNNENNTDNENNTNETNTSDTTITNNSNGTTNHPNDNGTTSDKDETSNNEKSNNDENNENNEMKSESNNENTSNSDPISDNQESNDGSKIRKQQSTDTKDDDSDVYDDSHEKTNIVLQFRSVKSGGFIKLNDNKITMSSKGDDFTKFRVYIVENPNIVKLESTQHAGRYIRVTEKKGIHVGKGGPHCQMTLLRME